MYFVYTLQQQSDQDVQNTQLVAENLQLSLLVTLLGCDPIIDVKQFLLIYTLHLIRFCLIERSKDMQHIQVSTKISCHLRGLNYECMKNWL